MKRARTLVLALLGIALASCADPESCTDPERLVVGDAVLAGAVHSPARYTTATLQGWLEHRALLAQLDFDGNVDLVVFAVRDCDEGLTEATLPVLALRGDGRGGFGVPVEVDPAGVCDVDVADFDGDGKDDLIVTRVGETRVFFDPLVGGPPTVVLDRGGAVAAGDVNDDGIPDLVVGQGQNVSWFTEDGDRGFTLESDVNLDTTIADGALGQFDQEAGLDLAIAGRTGACGPECNAISFFYAFFDDLEATPDETVTGFYPAPVQLKAVNLDGMDRDELIVQKLASPGHWMVHAPEGWVTRELPRPEKVLTRVIAVGDVDGDGHSDLLVAGPVIDPGEAASGSGSPSAFCGAVTAYRANSIDSTIELGMADSFSREGWNATAIVLGAVDSDEKIDAVFLVLDADTGPGDVFGIRTLHGM